MERTDLVIMKGRLEQMLEQVNNELGIVAPPAKEGSVLIIKVGSKPGQGLGYLEDKTMVLVDDASDLIGQQVAFRITMVHQTQHGKQLFAKMLVP